MPKRTVRDYIILAVKGVCMGAVDVVPGVSGGTIAFITGIYEELIDSIKSINLSLFRLLFEGKFSAFWRKLNGNFLLVLAGGILVSIFSLAKIITYMLSTYPIHVWSFFMGLVIAAAIYVLKSLKGLRIPDGFLLATGIVAGVAISLLSPAETPSGYWFIFLTGAIAICAWILPAISGMFIVLLLGKYSVIMEAVANIYWDIIIVFAAGAIIGIVSFSRLLSWLLRNYYNPTVCFFAGVMLGSILKIWPWKEFISEGVQRNLLPAQYELIHGVPPQIGVAVVFVVSGFLIVFGIEFLAKQMKQAK